MADSLDAKHDALLARLCQQVPEGHEQRWAAIARLFNESTGEARSSLWCKNRSKRALSARCHVEAVPPVATESTSVPLPEQHIGEEQTGTLKEQGNRLFAKGFYKEAKELCTEAMRENQTPALLTNRAAWNHRLGCFRKAAEDCDRAIQLGGSWVRAYERKVRALIELRKYSEAEGTLKRGSASGSTTCEFLDISSDSGRHCDRVQGHCPFCW